MVRGMALLACVVALCASGAWAAGKVEDEAEMPWVRDMDENHEHNEYYTDKRPSGLEYIDYVDGSGIPLKSGHDIKVMYKLYLKEGHKHIYSQATPEDAFALTLGRSAVIRGFTDALTGMKRGGRRVAFLPSEMAYGSHGARSFGIPQNADLIYYLEVLGGSSGPDEDFEL